MPETLTTAKPFRMSEFIKDGYLAEALRNELAGLKGEQLRLAQEAITDTATAGVPGTFEQLLGSYRRGIRRALHPERELLRNPMIDRKVIKNPTLAAELDKELRDVTKEELARANVALKAVLDEARNITVRGGPGEQRFASHPVSEVCGLRKEHSTTPTGDEEGCGYFKDPAEWTEGLRAVVKKAIQPED